MNFCWPSFEYSTDCQRQLMEKLARSLMKLERRQLKTLGGCACVQTYWWLKIFIEDFSLESWRQKIFILEKKDIWHFSKEKRHVLKWSRRFLTVECRQACLRFLKKKTLSRNTYIFQSSKCLNSQDLCTFMYLKSSTWCLIHEMSRSQT